MVLAIELHLLTRLGQFESFIELIRGKNLVGFTSFPVITEVFEMLAIKYKFVRTACYTVQNILVDKTFLMKLSQHISPAFTIVNDETPVFQIPPARSYSLVLNIQMQFPGISLDSYAVLDS